jgi:uncharacterized protein (UPF0332 family)
LIEISPSVNTTFSKYSSVAAFRLASASDGESPVLTTPSSEHLTTYAGLHAAKAALLTRGIVTESHTAVRRLFGKELVQQGLLEKEWAMVLAHEQDGRASADYDVELSFSQEVAGQRVEQAQRFLKRISCFCRRKGSMKSLPEVCLTYTNPITEPSDS